MHDWLATWAGAEKVLEQILLLYPEADLFMLFNLLPPNQRAILGDRKVFTSFFQKIPFTRKFYRYYLPLMPFAVEQLDLTAYNLVLSSSHAIAKSVITTPDQLHISYVHSPMRYAWDLQSLYLNKTGLDRGLRGFFTRLLLHHMRLWDTQTANGVDHFIANSSFIARRIWKAYRRETTIIPPPVNVEDFSLQEEKEDFYLTASRLVPYKRVDLIVEAFSQMKDKKLIVIGEGPEEKKIRAKATENISLLGYQDFSSLRSHMQKAKAFIFAAKEDFGIAPVEAQACGTPVIAFGEGGAAETIRGMDDPLPTGIFFKEQTVESLRTAIQLFENKLKNITPRNCRENALRFSVDYFRSQYKKFVEDRWELFHSGQTSFKKPSFVA